MGKLTVAALSEQFGEWKAEYEAKFDSTKAEYEKRFQALINENGKTNDELSKTKTSLSNAILERKKEVDGLTETVQGLNQEIENALAEIERVNSHLRGLDGRTGDDEADEPLNVVAALENLRHRLEDMVIPFVIEERRINKNFRDKAQSVAEKYGVG